MSVWFSGALWKVTFYKDRIYNLEIMKLFNYHPKRPSKNFLSSKLFCQSFLEYILHPIPNIQIANKPKLKLHVFYKKGI